MKKSTALFMPALILSWILQLAMTSEVFAQGNFTAPTCAKKYPFYPQGWRPFPD